MIWGVLSATSLPMDVRVSLKDMFPLLAEDVNYFVHKRERINLILFERIPRDFQYLYIYIAHT